MDPRHICEGQAVPASLNSPVMGHAHWMWDFEGHARPHWGAEESLGPDALLEQVLSQVSQHLNR